ncbi:FAD linked oxidase N-terminal protein [Dioscorea alata]|uniref:FAD linked oxidase N-terminal protein n=1 Tax=Dioscorea alata TaxID=55571 RepID=A0ACB7V4R2_DIOAL|nr:FAD linked oxidase N-terminal protein [Dioscorea alata]
MTPLLLLLLLLPSLPTSSSSTTTTTPSPPSNISSCLLAAGVLNFTTPSSSPTTFSHLLHFSIQNLRFSSLLPKPSIIILPSSLADLISSILCSTHSHLSIRLRSGGHSYEGLSYLSSLPFSLIDLINLNHLHFHPSSLSLWVQTGSTLGQTYHFISTLNHSLAFSAGSCPTVGIGGHISGGGYGFLSRKYGLAADNVIDAILVDFSGRVLDRKSMGEDVFWAIRGGGGGTWGAVFAWRLQLLPVPTTVTGFIVNRLGSWQRVGPSLPDEFYLSVFIGAGLPQMVNRTVEPNRTVEDLKDRVLHDRKFFKAKSDYVREPISRQDWMAVIEWLVMEPKAHLILDPYGGAMSRINGGDLPFPHRDGNLYGIQYLIEWTAEDEGKGQEYIEWLREFYEFTRGLVSKGPRAAYVNYLDLDLGVNYWDLNGDNARVYGEKYYLGNYDRLVKAKTAIDPNNVFNNPQSVPPLRLSFSASSENGQSAG